MRMLRQATRSAFSKAYELYQRQRKPMIPFTSLQKGNYELKASPSSSSSSSSSSWFLTGPSLHHMQRKDIGYYTDSCHDYGNSALSIPHQSTRSITSYSMLLSSQQPQQEGTRKDLAAQDEDPFDSITDKIPERPVTFVEGASYSIAIFAGLAIALGAAYAVFKELIFEPKEYTTFGKALERVQNDHQVTVRLGSPIKGYGQESRNRAARQRISNRVWTDEDGVERIEVQFHIRGPRGAGIIHTEMFKDKVERKWKFTYLLVDITSPSPTRLMLESYVPK